MAGETFTTLWKQGAYYDRKCPCGWVLPKGWHVVECPKCGMDLRSIRVKIVRERRCPHCNTVNSPKAFEEKFCRKCLVNLDQVSSMGGEWFEH